MGLEGVELVIETEERFNISISDEEAENLKTVGDLHRLVLSKVNHKVDNRCASSTAFYHVRQILGRITGTPTSSIKLRTTIASLIPVDIREEQWPLVEEELDCSLPLYRTSNVLWLFAFIYLFFLVMVIISTGLDPNVIVVMIFGSFLVFKLMLHVTEPLAVCIPVDDVKDLTNHVLRKREYMFLDAEKTMNQNDIWIVVRNIVSIVLGTDPANLKKSTRFIEDLNL